MLTQRKNSSTEQLPSDSPSNEKEAEQKSDSSADNSQPTAGAAKKKGAASLKKVLAIALVLSFLGLGGIFAYNYFSTFQETDDAYITAHISPISSRVDANVLRIYIDDNQHVKAGQLVVELDSRDYDRQVDRARAELNRVQREAEVAKRNIDLASKTAQAASLNASGDSSSNDALIQQSTAAISQARFALAEQENVLQEKEAEFVRATNDYKRFETLEAQGVITTSERDAARRDFDVTRAAVDAAKHAIEQKTSFIDQTTHQLEVARAKRVQSTGLERNAESRSIEVDVNKLQSEVSQAAIKEAETKLADALLKQSYCRIYAPVSGRIGRKTVELGQRVQPGSRLFTLTEDELWVVANFKENQLERMEVGQPVEIKVDILPGRRFKGTVESFSPGSGAQFTLLPPDNATGNFTKIVQRVPVKILFTDAIGDLRKKLVPGLSVIATVKVK